MAFELYFFNFCEGEPAALDGAAVKAVLARHGLRNDGSRPYTTTIDGVVVELNADLSDDRGELHVATRGSSPGLIRLVFELAQEARLVAIVPGDPSVPLITDPEMRKELPESDMTEPVVCKSAEDFASLLRPAFDEWADWVDSRTN